MSMEADNQAAKGSNRKKIIVIVCIALALLLLLLSLWFFLGKDEEPAPTEPSTEETTEEPTEPPTEGVTEPQMLPHMKELYDQNPDIVGWLTIEDTVVDYPVMYTPDDGEKYIHLTFEGTYSFAGELFIEDDCSMDPESDNLIIYGHNMKDGSMFRTILSYRKADFWEEHKTMTFTTLYEERTYEVVAAFYDRVYYKHENVFKFYQFIDAEDEEDYAEAVAYYKKKALVDTGVTPEFGDRLLTLVTCTSYGDDGRFVVIAREVPADTTPEG